MTEKEWEKLLATYTSPRQVAVECLEGLEDHLNTPCTKGNTRTVATRASGKRGLPPFRAEPTVCDRGSRGCGLEHNDGQALRFALMGFRRVRELAA